MTLVVGLRWGQLPATKESYDLWLTGCDVSWLATYMEATETTTEEAMSIEEAMSMLQLANRLEAAAIDAGSPAIEMRRVREMYAQVARTVSFDQIIEWQNR